MLPHVLSRLEALPRETFGHYPTPVEPLDRLREALGARPRLLVKRDDAISFGFGGNKVRKLSLVAAAARADGADTLVTCGGVQSNHARATAAAAARLGFRCVLVANGERPERPTGNALLDALLGAEIHYVSGRADRAPAMREIAERLRDEGRRPAEIPLGASTPLGALGYAIAVGELVAQGVRPDVIVHASSSGGTQAGLIAGCAIHGLASRVIGVSADDRSAEIVVTVRRIIDGMSGMLGGAMSDVARDAVVTVDDEFVGPGYGMPSDASREAQQLAARTEALFVDHWYTAKALAALIAYAREGRFGDDETVLFWHTGGQVGLFA
jgi:D-cysteine desulfhydrase